MRFQYIQSRIQNAQSLDFGKILEQCINLFKVVWLKGLTMVLVVMVFGFALSFLLIFIGLIPNPYDNVGYGNTGIFSFYTRSALDNLLQTILVTPFVFGMLAGFYRTCKQVDLKQSPDDDMFYFFKGDHLRKVLLLGLIYAIIASVAQALFLIPYIYVFIPLSFFSVFFANNPELSEGEIVKLSFSLGTKKWFITFGLMFVTGILGALGLIACGVGVLFTISIVYLPVYFVYRDIVGFEDDNEIQQIGME